MWFLNFNIWQFGALEILNLHVAPMPPTKFQLNPTYILEEMLKIWKVYVVQLLVFIYSGIQ